MLVALALIDCIHGSAGSATVGPIAQQWVPRVLCMHPDLVRAPRLQPPLQQRCQRLHPAAPAAALCSQHACPYTPHPKILHATH